jgi:integrase
LPANLYKRGSTFYARFSVNGELQRVSLRTGNPKEARLRFKAIREKAERQAFGIADAVTWEAAVLAYARGVLDAGGVKPGTAKRYRVSLRQIGPRFEGRSLHHITVKEIAQFVAARQAEGATNATIRRDLTTISRVLAFARSEGMIESNATDAYDRKLVREHRAAIHEPSEAMIEAGAEAAEAAGLPALAELIRFLRGTGVRAGEALRARWEHVRAGQMTIYETKSGRVRTIVVPPTVLPPRGEGRLFATLPEDSLTVAGRWAWVKRRLPRTQHFRLHDLRHAYAIAEIRAGRDIYDLSHHLGHSSVKVTEMYLGYVAGGRAKPRLSPGR